MEKPSMQELFRCAKECHEMLREADIPHVLIGGIAVCLHGFMRETRDVDFLVRGEHRKKIRRLLASKGFERKRRTIFCSPEGVKVGFRARCDDPIEFEASLPDPGNAEFHTAFDELPGLPVFGDKFELMKHKLECGILSQGRGGKWKKRSKKHFKDVVGLIAGNDLLPITKESGTRTD